jgi:putative transposase
MARPLRIQYPGAFYHVTSRGNERKAIYRNDKDRTKFLSYLESASERYDALIHAYCLMDNHYHLLLETPRSNLSQILHHVNGAYTTYFNVKRDRCGHLFQGRYKAILVEKDAYCQELSRYIHLNPVRAGIAKSPSEYTWSSFCYFIGLKESPGWLRDELILGYFDKDRNVAERLYRDFVEKGLETDLEEPFKEVFASTFLGKEEFISWAKEKWIAYKNADARNIPVLKRLMSKPSFEAIDQIVESVIGKENGFFKKFCLYTSHQMVGLPLKEIGAYYDMRGSAVSQSNRRLKQRISKDKKLGQMEKEIKNRINPVEC